jgi:dTDP-4-dehydrorhamnose reductase
MKILILGAGGMLGHQLCLYLNSCGEVFAVFRKEKSHYDGFGLVDSSNGYGNIDVTDFPAVKRVLDLVRPNVVVNAVGIVKQRRDAKAAIPSITVNGLLPHLLMEASLEIGARLIHFSTDCVFSGNGGEYREEDIPDPVDLYGRTKLVGEVDEAGCLTLRTSIIGWEIENRASLLEWFAAQRGCIINGYRKAIYTGLSTSAMAKLVGRVITEHPDLSGLYHVASAPISKYDLLTRLADRLGWHDIQIRPEDDFRCDRSLIGTRFETATGWKPPDWNEMIEGLSEEWPVYDKWRRDAK